MIENILFVINSYKTINDAIKNGIIKKVFTYRELETKLNYNINRAYNDFIRLVKMGVIMQTERGHLKGILVDKEEINAKVINVAISLRQCAKQYENEAKYCDKLLEDFNQY